MIPLVIVLIAPPGELTDAMAGEARALVARDGGTKPRWLACGEACEIPLFAGSGVEAETLRHRLTHEIAQGALAGRPVDVALIPNEHRRKKLLVADMESTIIAEECLDELAGLAGLREKIEPITLRAMRGEIPFEAALRERVALLAGVGEEILARVLGEITFMPGARTLVRTMKKHGAHTALVSGGFSYFARPIAEKAEFDSHQSNALVISDGKLTGEAVSPILGRDAKREALTGQRERLGLLPAETLAVGDGANDLAMIEAAGLGVAFRAKPAIAAKAHASIVHGDLTALLYLQGYRREEFET